jgi:HNH endonuclease
MKFPKRKYCKGTTSEKLAYYSILDEKTGCLEWTAGTTPKGYGTIYADGKMDLAHRVSFRLNGGLLDKGPYVLHKCDNPSCINPEHLFSGTQLHNVQDAIQKGRHYKGGPRGHSLCGEEHPKAKLVAEDVVFIRKSSLKQIELAKKYSVSPMTIWGIKHHLTWKTV